MGYGVQRALLSGDILFFDKTKKIFTAQDRLGKPLLFDKGKNGDKLFIGEADPCFIAKALANAANREIGESNFNYGKNRALSCFSLV